MTEHDDEASILHRDLYDFEKISQKSDRITTEFFALSSPRFSGKAK